MDGIKTILFDIDGTVLDTGEFIIQATENSLKTLGYSVPGRSVIKKVIGTPFPDYYIELSGSTKDADRLVEIHRAFQTSNFQLAKIFPNALETLKYLKQKGYTLAAVTSRSNRTSDQTLKNAGIFEFFDAVISGEDTKELKPDPAPLFKALERLGEVPEKTVMVGDSDVDVQAGKSAGTKTIRAMYGSHKENLHNPEPDLFIEDIKDLLKIL